MLSPEFLRGKFEAGLAFGPYVASGRPDQAAAWNKQHALVHLTEGHLALIRSFQRRFNVLLTSGLWCGDCAAQVPILDHVARASSLIQLRILDRDTHLDLAEQVAICGGLRVPTVLFLNEDFEFVSLHGDKSLARMRAQAAKSVGPYCALPGSPADERPATVDDWVRAFEFAHLVVRLSPKLRQRHDD